MSYAGIAPTPPRTYEFWTAALTRLASATMATVLGGAGRIKLATDDMVPLGAETAYWGRMVLAPVARLYGEPEEDLGRRRMVPFLIRTEVHSPGSGYQPALSLEAAHAEAFALLHGWTPGVFSTARVVGQVWRETAPQSLPLWDSASGLWFLSAEYRAILAPV